MFMLMIGTYQSFQVSHPVDNTKHIYRFIDPMPIYMSTWHMYNCILFDSAILSNDFVLLLSDH